MGSISRATWTGSVSSDFLGFEYLPKGTEVANSVTGITITNPFLKHQYLYRVNHQLQKWCVTKHLHIVDAVLCLSCFILFLQSFYIRFSNCHLYVWCRVCPRVTAWGCSGSCNKKRGHSLRRRCFCTTMFIQTQNKASVFKNRSSFFILFLFAKLNVLFCLVTLFEILHNPHDDGLFVTLRKSSMCEPQYN